MPLQLIRQDITTMRVDAIVNAANESLLGGGGVDGAIHRAAGPGLLAECRTLHGCPTGKAKLTGAYRLPCRYVIHTVGPIWEGGACGEEQLLRSCYRNSFALARDAGCTSLAFPLISAGVYGYPVRQAFRVALDTLSDELAASGSDMLVYLVLFDKAAAALSEKLYGDLDSYIDDTYAEAQEEKYPRSDVRKKAPGSLGFLKKEKAGRREKQSLRPEAIDGLGAAPEARPDEAAEQACFAEIAGAASAPAPECVEAAALKPAAAPKDAGAFTVDEGFSAMLLRKIDEKGMTDPECYKKANIDKKLFSKIRSNPQYRPSKPTVLAFAVALRLSLPETREMLMKAGYALSHSFLLDVIVEYYLRKGCYDIYEINWTLLQNDQPQLGSVTE